MIRPALIVIAAAMVVIGGGEDGWWPAVANDAGLWPAAAFCLALLAIALVTAALYLAWLSGRERGR